MKNNFYLLWASIIALFCTTTAKAQLFVDTGYTVPQMVTDFFGDNECVTVSNITYTGSNGAVGFFDGILSNAGLGAGLLLTSGKATNAIGPNDSGSASEGIGLGGDANLDSLISGFITYDAAVLEFDIVATEPTIEFKYVFGSEEYLEYVGSSFNDVFGFFIGPVGGAMQNIAFIPDTDVPVSINNVNNAAYPEYYVNNGDGMVSPQNTEPQYVQYDGLTVPLTATANVVPGNTYHVKIAVADAGDSALDSGVFLSTESLCGEGAISPMGSFDATVDGGTVFLQNDARYAITYNWSFGDGSTSTQRNPPAHTYAQNGTYTITLDAANNCCSTRFTQTIVIGEATGNNTPTAQTVLQVYPNPSTNGKVQVQTPNATALYLYDITGKLLASANQSTTTFDLANFGKGIYLVKAIMPNGAIYVEKLNY